jgi:uncharacterized membrane protein
MVGAAKAAAAPTAVVRTKLLLDTLFFSFIWLNYKGLLVPYTWFVQSWKKPDKNQIYARCLIIVC